MNVRPSLPLLLCSLLLLAAPLACAPAETPPPEDAAAPTAPVVAQAEALPLPPRAQEARPSPNASVSQAIGTTVVTLTYGRPGVKGRQVFGGLEPYGQVWRAGANEATVFHTSTDVSINGQPLAAGAYAFFATPTAGDWTLHFNSQAEQWGAFNRDPALDVLTVTVTPEAGPPQEWLQYSFENLTPTAADVVLHWDTVRVPFTVSL